MAFLLAERKVSKMTLSELIRSESGTKPMSDGIIKGAYEESIVDMLTVGADTAYTDFLKVVGRFPEHRPVVSMLIAEQTKDGKPPTDIRHAKAWEKEGRIPRKGTTALYTISHSKDEGDNITFKRVAGFDISQVARKDKEASKELNTLPHTYSEGKWMREVGFESLLKALEDAAPHKISYESFTNGKTKGYFAGSDGVIKVKEHPASHEKAKGIIEAIASIETRSRVGSEASGFNFSDKAIKLQEDSIAYALCARYHMRFDNHNLTKNNLKQDWLNANDFGEFIQSQKFIQKAVNDLSKVIDVQIDKHIALAEKEKVRAEIFGRGKSELSDRESPPQKQHQPQKPQRQPQPKTQSPIQKTIEQKRNDYINTQKGQAIFIDPGVVFDDLDIPGYAMVKDGVAHQQGIQLHYLVKADLINRSDWTYDNKNNDAIPIPTIGEWNIEVCFTQKDFGEMFDGFDEANVDEDTQELWTKHGAKQEFISLSEAYRCFCVEQFAGTDIGGEVVKNVQATHERNMKVLDDFEKLVLGKIRAVGNEVDSKPTKTLTPPKEVSKPTPTPTPTPPSPTR